MDEVDGTSQVGRTQKDTGIHGTRGKNEECLPSTCARGERHEDQRTQRRDRRARLRYMSRSVRDGPRRTEMRRHPAADDKDESTAIPHMAECEHGSSYVRAPRGVTQGVER